MRDGVAIGVRLLPQYIAGEVVGELVARVPSVVVKVHLSFGARGPPPRPTVGVCT